MINTNKAKGSCLCNTVQFEIELPTLWAAHCHCNQCRKSHGAGYVTWIGVEDKSFKYISGDNSIKWHQSSVKAQRGFCQNCGSSLFFISPDWEGEIHIVYASFDDNLDKKPQTNAFFKTHIDWMPIDNTLKQID